MSDTIIIVNAEHWLNEDGDLPVEAPSEIYRNALRMAQCIEYAGPSPKEHLTLTLIPCRRRPSGVACRGTLAVVKTAQDEIHAFCLACRQDEFLICNWQSTIWADGPPVPIPVEEEPAGGSEVLPDDVNLQLQRALASVGSSLAVGDVVQLVATNDSPGVVLQQVMQRSQPADMRDAQRVADAVMAAWNATPRAELGGRAPSEVYRDSRSRMPASAPPKVGRNQPCPCGSGNKYKKCCGRFH